MKQILGTMTFGESVFSPEAEWLLAAFFAAGGREIDTAYVYNEGECERILGRALEGNGEVFIATKANPRVTGRLDGAACRMQVEESLARLKKKSVDLLYLHFPDPATPVASALDEVGRLYEEGKINALGLSNFPAWMVADAWHYCKQNGIVTPTVYEGMYNPLTRGAEAELDACLNAFSMRFYAYNPLAGGLLSGRYSAFTEEPGDGRFTHRPNYRKRYWKESYFAAIDILKKAVEEENVTLPEAVMRYLAHHSMLNGARGDGVIIGASKLSHLTDNMAALKGGELPQKVLDAFEAAWELCRADSPAYFTLYKNPAGKEK